MKRQRRKHEEGHRLDMTPMIDVTFLLLIFFLCLEFKTLEGKLAMNLPKEHGPSTRHVDPQEHVDLAIFVAQMGTRRLDARTGRQLLEGHRAKYRVGATWVRDESRLTDLLHREGRVRVADPTGLPRPRPLRIASSPGVVYRDVTTAIDIARSAGFERISFAAVK